MKRQLSNTIYDLKFAIEKNDFERIKSSSGKRSTMRCWNLVTLSMPTATTNNRSNSTVICVKKRPDYQKRHEKLIFLHDNAPLHTSKMVENYFETRNWEVLPHVAYPPNLAPSDYHPFSSMGHAFATQHFDCCEHVRNWLDEWFLSKEKEFF